MKVLITGITGFVGGHLAEHLLAAGGHAVVGVSRAGAWPAGLGHLAAAVELIPGDLNDGGRTTELVRLAAPDWLIHLAGYANTGGSFKEPDRCWRENLDATRVLYDAVGRSGVRPRILFVSTGLVYGDPDEPGAACDERTTFKPASPYAASKAAADILSYQVTRSPGLDVVRVRLFNQLGPRQPADYAVPNFARQIAAIEAGRQPPVIDTGNLSAERDVTDVRDVVAAFPLLLDRGRTGEAYNAGHGEARRIRHLLDRLVALARVPVEVRETAPPARAADTAVTRADARKLREATGWQPHIPLDQTLADVLDYWRSVS